MCLQKAFLDHADGLSRVEVLRARVCAIHYSLAPIQLKWVIKLQQALLSELITRVDDPAVCLAHRPSRHRRFNFNSLKEHKYNKTYLYLHENSGAQVFVLVPPVARTGG